ncbi:Ferrous iron transporter FeoA domain-containing protein [Novosphingobium lubricantis]
MHLLARYGSATGVTLDLLPIGTPARIAAVDWSVLVAEEARRLRALGLDVGARVTLAHRGVFLGRDPLAVEIGRMTVAIRRVHARAMQVEPITETAPA